MPQPTAAPVQTSAERQIARAKDLEKQRAALQTSIGKNRDYLRLMDANDELDAEQSKWLKTFYPDKEKGSTRSEDEIKATREARKAARD